MNSSKFDGYNKQIQKEMLSYIDSKNNLHGKHYFSQEPTLEKLGAYLGIEALSLYNLADNIWGSTPPEPESMFWDHEYIEYYKNHQPELLVEFFDFSDTLIKWLKELPQSYNVHNHINDCKEKITFMEN